MFVSSEKVLLTSSLVPPSIIDRLQTEKVEEALSENAMCAVAILIVNTVINAIEAFRNKKYKEFDANPGDGGCQCRALELRRLAMVNLNDEYDSLAKEARVIKNLVNLRKGSPKSQTKCSTKMFFEQHFAHLRISKEMEYLLQCYLSTTMRTPYRTLPNGIVLTKSDMSRLSKLSPKIGGALDGYLRDKILQQNQEKLSNLSVEAMRFSAMQIQTMEVEEKKLVVTMLSKEHTHYFAPSGFAPKAFGCLFYEIKTVLFRMREELGIVALRNIGTLVEHFHVLWQPPTQEKDFETLPSAAKAILSPMTPIVVFEAVFSVEKQEAISLIEKFGFSATMLSLAANEAPYEVTSSLNDVKEPEAIREISLYREKVKELGGFMILDHIYLNNLTSIK